MVFVGADDAGRSVGLEITDRLLLQLTDIKTDGNIVPPPTLTVGRHVLRGRVVAVVTVVAGGFPAGAPSGADLGTRRSSPCGDERSGRENPEREATTP